MIRLSLIAIYLACLSLMVFVGLNYHEISPGLADWRSDGPFFCAELLSSGEDDSAMLLAFALFALPLVLRIILFNRRVATFELTMFLCCGLATAFALWLASLDCASIFYTAFVVPDLFWASALFALPVATLSLFALRKSK
ncbi:hypothetical protein SDC9_89835 [bioreactor metagenome]|uniref:Uncharacterized protein n=1 Tax=bioreactor metagenome TaxID=1076179 RepID=A0A644ZQM1_9ZZZZ